MVNEFHFLRDDDRRPASRGHVRRRFAILTDALGDVLGEFRKQGRDDVDDRLRDIEARLERLEAQLATERRLKRPRQRNSK